ncbi:hypothetical protein B0H19DRAFT_1070303 [Mycena capillaripes]|nr:hypothetical protein B0H19DRAFT_1070303 [Mycena capillaripes]
MDSIPYIDRPLPPTSTRIEWQLFSARPVPSITARMNREEIEQIIGYKSPLEDPMLPAKYREPPGQPNRPLSGGYGLEAHLVDKCEWTKSQFKEVQAEVHQLAAQKLDVTTCYQKQKKHTIQHICDEVKKNHPIAHGFDGCWPIRDMLMVHLKNTSEAERRRKHWSVLSRVPGPVVE